MELSGGEKQDKGKAVRAVEGLELHWGVRAGAQVSPGPWVSEFASLVLQWQGPRRKASRREHLYFNHPSGLSPLLRGALRGPCFQLPEVPLSAHH